MSLPEYLQPSGTESACCEAVLRARWPTGCACPRCGSAHCDLFSLGGPLFQCNGCHGQTSLTAGTLFGSTELPLTTWFLAISLISQAKTGRSALELKHYIGLSYPTAWLLRHEITMAVIARATRHRLTGKVQVDDAHLGGERAGGKPGRGPENKVAFVAAVSLDEAGNPRPAKPTPLPGFPSEAISAWARANLTAGASVLSDGVACVAAVTDAGCTQTVEVVGQRKPRERAQFNWVNTVLANIKALISGAFKAFGYARYADRCLGAFTDRFDHRFDLSDHVVRLIVGVCRFTATPARLIRLAQVHFESGEVLTST